jgi:tetratricopeptide (TPR) repeat protein
MESMRMDKKTKASCIIFAAIALIFFLGLGAAYPDAPGVPNPGSRVPPRTARAVVTQKSAGAVKKVSRPRRSKKPKPAPVTQKHAAEAVNPLNEAVSFIKQERYKSALPHILRAIKEQPRNADAWYWFGIWSDRTGNFSNAQKYFTRALEIDPDYPALSRVVVYPRDPYEKNPLWDSIRPPAIETVYPIEINAAAYDYPESVSEIYSEIPIYQPPAP